MANSTGLRVLVFAKAPIAGKVKTRLCPPLSSDDAAKLQQRMLRHTLNTASRAGLGAVELHCANDLQHSFFAECQNEFDIELKHQVDGDLGVKMHTALDQALTRTDHVLLIGSDCPSITADYLRAAALTLTSAKPIVFGPAEDGGYGLIGVRDRTPDIFSNVPWGATSVMESTRRILIAKGLTWSELPPVWDVDRPEDLARVAGNADLNYLMKELVRVAIAR